MGCRLFHSQILTAGVMVLRSIRADRDNLRSRVVGRISREKQAAAARVPAMVRLESRDVFPFDQFILIAVSRAEPPSS